MSTSPDGTGQRTYELMSYSEWCQEFRDVVKKILQTNISILLHCLPLSRVQEINRTRLTSPSIWRILKVKCHCERSLHLFKATVEVDMTVFLAAPVDPPASTVAGEGDIPCGHWRCSFWYSLDDPPLYVEQYSDSPTVRLLVQSSDVYFAVHLASVMTASWASTLL